MRRWLSEFNNPSLKCARVGHSPRTIERQFYERPTTWHSVADRVRIAVTDCRRCGVELERHEVDRTGLSGLTMPTAMWDELKDKGTVEA